MGFGESIPLTDLEKLRLCEVLCLHYRKYGHIGIYHWVWAFHHKGDPFNVLKEF